MEAAITGELYMKGYTTRMWLIAWGAATLDCGALLFGTLAYQKDRAGSASLLSYLSIVYGFVVDKVIFQEESNYTELVAAIVILFSSLGVAFYKLRQQRISENLLKLEQEQQEKLQKEKQKEE